MLRKKYKNERNEDIDVESIEIVEQDFFLKYKQGTSEKYEYVFSEFDFIHKTW